jgi:hypothetical protein
VLSKLLVDERVIRTPQFDRVAVVTQLTEQEQLGFFGQRIAQRDVVIGEILLIGIGFAELVEFQPRKKEARDEGLGAIVCEHPVDLAFKGGGIAQAVALRVLK